MGRAARVWALIPVEELEQQPLFVEFDPLSLRAVAALMTRRDAPSGTVLLEQGQRSGGVFVVLSGQVNMIRTEDARPAALLGTLGPGSLLGATAALDGAPRSASIVATQASVLAALPATAFMELMEGRSRVALRFQLAVVCSLFRDLRRGNRLLAATLVPGDPPPS